MKMIVGKTWNAKIEPEFGGRSFPNAPEFGSPNWPNKTCVPANVAESMLFTTLPAQVMNRCP
jgi:hypothetical protein